MSGLSTQSIAVEGVMLISFCNQLSSPLHSLCFFDLKNGGVRWIDLSAIPEIFKGGLQGICGICCVGAQVILATQGNNPLLVIVDLETASIDSYTILRGCKDTHSIVFHDGFIYAVSTGTNEIYRVPFHNGILGNEELYWQYPAVGYDKDEIHLNGLTLDCGRLVASCFGQRTDEGKWGGAGRVFYVDDGTDIFKGLSQPHSPIVIDGYLAFGESKLGRVYLYDKSDAGAWLNQRIFDVNGYARGINFLGREILVGLSADRKVSRSQQIYLGDSGILRPSSLVCINIDTGRVHSIPHIGLLGKEIYDLALIDRRYEVDSIENALGARLNSMESVVLAKTVSTRELANEMQRLSTEYRNVLDKYNKLQEQQDKMLFSRVARLINRMVKHLH